MISPQILQKPTSGWPVLSSSRCIYRSLQSEWSETVQFSLFQSHCMDWTVL